MEIQIRKDTWHCRLYSWTFDTNRPPVTTSLCPYFWRVATTIFVIMFVTMLCGVALWHTYHNFWEVLSFVLKLAAALAIAIALIFVAYSYHESGFRKRRKQRREQHGERALIIPYMKALYHRVCPIITFVDPPEPEEEPA